MTRIMKRYHRQILVMQTYYRNFVGKQFKTNFIQCSSGGGLKSDFDFLVPS